MVNCEKHEYLAMLRSEGTSSLASAQLSVSVAFGSGGSTPAQPVLHDVWHPFDPFEGNSDRGWPTVSLQLALRHVSINQRCAFLA